MTDAQIPPTPTERSRAEAQLLLDFRAAARRHAAEDFEAAEAQYRHILERAPEHGATLHLMGVLRGQQLKLKEAMTWFDRASEAAHQDDETTLCLAQALGEIGQPEAALMPCERVLQRNPGSTAALYLRVELLHRAKRPSDAGAAMDALQAHLASGQVDARVPVDWPSLLLDQGNLLLREGRKDEARRCYERAATAGADPDIVNFRLALVGAAEAPAVPRSMVHSLFNRYADLFDTHLLEHLDYRAPQVVAQAVAPHRPPGRLLATLDLGCGTGLSGLPVRSGASRLVGVDLSEKMLARARERGIYDELHAGELTDFLEGRAEPNAPPGALPGPFGLAVACDVLNYIGNLGPVHAAVAQVLEPGGLFAYSVELTGDEGPRIVLNPSLRFSHSAAGVRALAETHGFELLSLEEAALRKERGVDVRGLIAVLRRPA